MIAKFILNLLLKCIWFYLLTCLRDNVSRKPLFLAHLSLVTPVIVKFFVLSADVDSEFVWSSHHVIMTRISPRHGGTVPLDRTAEGQPEPTTTGRFTAGLHGRMSKYRNSHVKVKSKYRKEFVVSLNMTGHGNALFFRSLVIM